MSLTVTDPYGASDQKSISVTACPVIIEAVTLSRQSSNVTVQFNVRNTSASVTVNNVSINSATLKGLTTKTALPILYAQLKPGVVKQVQLKFAGVPSGPAQFVVSGTSSAGPVNANMTVTVP